MHAIPEKLSTLRQQIEATMIRRFTEQREEFEKMLQSSSKATEEAAVKRASDLINPEIGSLGERLQDRINSIRLQADQAPIRIAEVHEQLTAHREGTEPLHARADAAAVRLDRLGVQSAELTRDTSNLGQNLRESVSELRHRLDQEKQGREALAAEWKGLLKEASGTAAAATRAAVERADDQAKKSQQRDQDMESRLLKAMEEQAQRCLREAQTGDDDVKKKLMPELQSVAADAKHLADDSNAKSQALVRDAIAQLRGELQASCKRVASDSDRGADQKVRELANRVEQGLKSLDRRLDVVHSDAQTAIQDTAAKARVQVTDAMSALHSEAGRLRQHIKDTEDRASAFTEEAKKSSIATSLDHLEDFAKQTHQHLGELQEFAQSSIEALRKESRKLVDETASRLDQVIQDTGSKCNASSQATVGETAAQLRDELATAMKNANSRTDDARCAASKALTQEVQARQQALDEAKAARDALSADLQKRLKNTAADLASATHAVSVAADQHAEANKVLISSVEHRLKVLGKDFEDTTSSLRTQLRAERQLTEESHAEATKTIAQAKDGLEARIRSDSAEFRAALSDCKKKLHEEVSSLRTELREKPDKHDVVDVSNAATERINEVVTTLNGHRTRLETAFAELSTRCREVRVEGNDARLRTQREAMVLGDEVTQLRAATSSLVNGVIKSLQVVGLLRDLREEASPGSPDATRRGIEAMRSPRAERHSTVEVGDLLKWEREGHSLARRVAHGWYDKESSGIPTMLAMVDRKVGPEELLELGKYFPTDTTAQPLTVFNYSAGHSTSATATDVLRMLSNSLTSPPGTGVAMHKDGSKPPSAPTAPAGQKPFTPQAPMSARRHNRPSSASLEIS